MRLNADGSGSRATRATGRGSSGSIGATARMEKNQKTVRETVSLADVQVPFASGPSVRELDAVDGLTRECLAPIPDRSISNGALP